MFTTHLKGATTVENLEATSRLVQDLITHLPPEAMLELGGGSAADVGALLRDIESTCFDVVTGRGSRAPIQSAPLGYLDKLSGALHEHLLVHDLNYFISSELPEFDLAWHCLEWGQMTMWYRLLCILAARDHSKSFFFSFAYPLWKLYQYERAAPGAPVDRRRQLCEKGIIISNTMALGQAFLEFIKTAIEEKDHLRARLFPTSRTRIWNTKSIKCANGARLDVASYPAKRGPHPGWIVADDLLDESHMYSAAARAKMQAFFENVLMNMIVPGGQVAVVGTPLHDSDIYSYLRKLKSWRYLEYPAIFPDGRILYPARHSWAGLMEKQDRNKLSFAQENLCRPISNASTIFPREILTKAIIGMSAFRLVENRASIPFRVKRIVMGCDFAISGQAGADFSVFSTFAIDEYGTLWLVHIHREKGASYLTQQTTLKRLHQQFAHDVIYMESNQMQIIFAEESERAGLPAYAHNTGANKASLRDGVPSLQPLFEKGRIRIPTGDDHSAEMAELILQEFGAIAFTDKGIRGVGAHDDIPMSFWIGIEAAKHNDYFGFA